MKGYCQRSTCPPAGHSVIHKMRPFQSSPLPVVAVMFIRKKVENGDEGIVFRKKFPAFFLYFLGVEFVRIAFDVFHNLITFSVSMDLSCLQMCSAYE